MADRGPLRVIYTTLRDAGGTDLGGKFGDQVGAIVGPIGDHTSHPELQDALGLVAMAFNRRHGNLSPKKHRELLANRFEDGAELLREALAALK